MTSHKMTSAAVRSRSVNRDVSLDAHKSISRINGNKLMTCGTDLDYQKFDPSVKVLMIKLNQLFY